MKTIINYINEVKHSFHIKSHLKKEEQDNGYKIYKFMESDNLFVALTTEEEITAFNNYKKCDKKYNSNQIISNNDWVAVWPDIGTGKVTSVDMPLEYLNNEKIYKYVCDIDSFDDITLDYWKKLKTKY